MTSKLIIGINNNNLNKDYRKILNITVLHVISNTSNQTSSLYFYFRYWNLFII